MAEQGAQTMNANLLVELGCEELPPKSLEKLADSFYQAVCKGLSDSGVPVDSNAGTVFYTPRRLGFRIPGVSGKQPDQVIDRRGPAVNAAFDDEGNPTQAALGFARSVGQEIDALERHKTDKGEWLFCRVNKPGKDLVEVLYPVMEKALATLPVAKPMRWSDHDFSFVRPVHWLMVLHGNEVLPGTLYGKNAGNQTKGHRIHSPGPHTVNSADDYERVLEEAHVIVNPQTRKEKINQLAIQAGKDLGASTRITDHLLSEVSNIIEWPAVVTCRFEDDFLEVPEEALIASMEDHQKFFPVLDPSSGRLTAHFVVIANIESTHVESVREGFERVIRPRLADARFFWDQDRKVNLDTYAGALDNVIFQRDLGSVGDKSRRIAEISSNIAEIIGADSSVAERSALLCKADLQTQMVGEFPELQGTMGSHYARVSGEDDQVSLAIGEHYSPRFAGDDIPSSKPGQLLSMADRMDTLVGIMAAGLKPTGNKDPFALRRAALGTVRILTEAGIRIPLDQLLEIAANALRPQLEVSDECIFDTRAFMLERLRQYYMDRGFDTNVVNATFAAPLGDLPDLGERLAALAGFMELPVADSLIAANKRIGNILKKSDYDKSVQIDANIINISEERRLFEEVIRLESDLKPLLDRADYPKVLNQLASLDDVISDFFDHVMVMDEDPAVRSNRLALLSRLKGMFDQVADLSQAT